MTAKSFWHLTGTGPHLKRKKTLNSHLKDLLSQPALASTYNAHGDVRREEGSRESICCPKAMTLRSENSSERLSVPFLVEIGPAYQGYSNKRSDESLINPSKTVSNLCASSSLPTHWEMQFQLQVRLLMLSSIFTSKIESNKPPKSQFSRTPLRAAQLFQKAPSCCPKHLEKYHHPGTLAKEGTFKAAKLFKSKSVTVWGVAFLSIWPPKLPQLLSEGSPNISYYSYNSEGLNRPTSC